MPSEASISANSANPPSSSTTKRRGETALSTSCCKRAKIVARQIRGDGLERGANRRGKLAPAEGSVRTTRSTEA